MKTYTASRVSDGNSVFPARIIISNTGVTLKIPGFFSGKETTIPFSEIASVITDSPLLGYSSVIIETTGSGRIKASGFTKSNVSEIKELILNAKSGKIEIQNVEGLKNQSKEKETEFSLSSGFVSLKCSTDHLDPKEKTQEEKEEEEKRNVHDKEIDDMMEEYKDRLKPEELLNRNAMLLGCARIIKEEKSKVELKKKMFLQRFDVLDTDRVMEHVKEGKIVFSFYNDDGEENVVDEYCDLESMSEDYTIGVFKDTETSRLKNVEYLLNELREYISQFYKINKPKKNLKENEVFGILKDAIESEGLFTNPIETERLQSYFDTFRKNAEIHLSEQPTYEEALSELIMAIEVL